MGEEHHQDDQEHLKLRCSSHHPLLHYNAQGIYLRCRHCKTIRFVPWDELYQIQQEAKQNLQR